MHCGLLLVIVVHVRLVVVQQDEVLLAQPALNLVHGNLRLFGVALPVYRVLVN